MEEIRRKGKLLWTKTGYKNVPKTEFKVKSLKLEVNLDLQGRNYTEMGGI